MKLCENCYKEAKDTDMFCKYCGTRLNITNDEQNEIQEQSKFEIDRSKDLKKYIITIAIYFFLFYIFSSVAQSIVNVVLLLLTNIFSINFSEEEKSLILVLWTNLIIYAAAAAAIIPIMVTSIKSDILDFKRRPGKNLMWTGISVASMYFASLFGQAITKLISQLIQFITEQTPPATSYNQQVIDEIMNSNIFNAILMFIPVVFIAPIVEELVFRKALFGIFKKRTILSVFISALVFASIHIVPACIIDAVGIITGANTYVDILYELAQIFEYLLAGAVFAVIYHVNNNNAIPGIIAHFANNLFASIVTIISAYLLPLLN